MSNGRRLVDNAEIEVPKVEFNPFDPDMMDQPSTFYDSLLSTPGLYKVREQDVYVVSRYDDIMAILRADGTTFSQRFRQGMAIRGGSNGFGLFSSEGVHPEAAEILKEYETSGGALIRTDPPIHTRHRMLVARAFTPRRVEALRPHIRNIAESLMEGWETGHTIDFVSSFASPLPLIVIADQLGIGRERLSDFRNWSDALAATSSGIVTYEQQPEMARNLVELQTYFRERIAERLVQPSDDMLGALVAATENGQVLTIPELLEILELLLAAGNETTTNLLVSSLLLLIENEEAMATVRRNPELIAQVVEEALRLEPPVQAMMRLVTDTIEIAGTEIPAGSRVFLLLGAGNRDPSRFQDPELLDFTRGNSRDHLAFGHGIHYCIGAALGRVEATIGLEVVLERTSDLELASRERLQRLPMIFVRGFAELPITYSSIRTSTPPEGCG